MLAAASQVTPLAERRTEAISSALGADEVRCIVVDDKGKEYGLCAAQGGYVGDTLRQAYTISLSKDRIRQVRLDRRPALKTRFDGIAINSTVKRAR